MSNSTTNASKPLRSSHASVPHREWFGSTHWILLRGADTAGAMTLVEGIYPTGTGTPPHVHHHEDEMFEVLEGRFKFQAGETFLEAGPGEVVWAPRGVAHCFTCISDTPGRLRFAVMPGGIDVMFEELAALPAGPPDVEKVTAICARYDITIL